MRRIDEWFAHVVGPQEKAQRRSDEHDVGALLAVDVELVGILVDLEEGLVQAAVAGLNPGDLGQPARLSGRAEDQRSRQDEQRQDTRHHGGGQEEAPRPGFGIRRDLDRDQHRLRTGNR
jgi:hypothetical protein